MTFYHGSPISGLNELKPFLSEHGKPYIYFATNPLVALLYAVKPVPKPFSFYPYGFDRNGSIVYSEYYENAFYELYKDKVGYLYECNNLKNIDAPTQINSAYASTESIKVDRVTKIPDLYVFYKEQEEKGLFRIKQKKEISDKEMRFVFDELRKDIEKNNLKHFPQHAMSIFIQKHFPTIWWEECRCYCGHDCSRCITYIATQTDDDTLRKQSQRFYKEQFKQDIPLEEFNCLGGRTDNVFKLCQKCPFRQCCIKRNISSCSLCLEYPCAMLKEYQKKYVNKCNVNLSN